MASKRLRTSTPDASSSKTAKFDKDKFISFEASERYKHSVVTKTCVPERGINCPGTLVNQHIEGRNWQEFVKQPSAALVPVVREFYANAKEHRNKKVFVRGKWVAFDSKAINKYYKLPNIVNDRYTQYRQEPDPDEIIQFLTSSRVHWKTSTTDVINFPSSGLAHKTKAWHYFISAKLLPSSNTSEVTKERAILNYAIFRGFSIDVGKIIEQSILDTIQGTTTGGLGHPSLIYDLCQQVGIPTTANEEIQHPKSVITRKKIESYKANAQRPTTAPTAPLPGPSSSGQPTNSSTELNALRHCVDQLQLMAHEQQQWRERVDQQLGQIQYNQDQIAARQDVQFDYLAQFTTSLGEMFSNCALNSGPDGIVFPQPPTLPPYTPVRRHHPTPARSAPPPDDNEDND